MELTHWPRGGSGPPPCPSQRQAAPQTSPHLASSPQTIKEAISTTAGEKSIRLTCERGRTGGLLESYGFVASFILLSLLTCNKSLQHTAQFINNFDELLLASIIRYIIIAYSIIYILLFHWTYSVANALASIACIKNPYNARSTIHLLFYVWFMALWDSPYIKNYSHQQANHDGNSRSLVVLRWLCVVELCYWPISCPHPQRAPGCPGRRTSG